MKIIFTLLICCSFFVKSNSQKLTYDIVKGSKTIGHLVALKTVIGDTTHIKITSEATFKLLFTFNLTYLLEEQFVNGVLVSGKAINYLNEKIQKQSEFKKTGDAYEVFLDGEKTVFNLNKITYSITNLYFDKPPNLDIIIFSQQFSEFLPLRKLSKTEFELESSNGNNMYYYKDDVLEKVEVSRTYAHFAFVLKK